MRLSYDDPIVKIYQGNALQMTIIPDESVQCVVTSPPYWGLRKYAGDQELVWGNNHCEHQWAVTEQVVYGDAKVRWQHAEAVPDAYEQWDTMKKSGRQTTGFCSLCGAWRGAYGLEPTPEMYVQHTVEILREIRRALRKDGVVFWNIGDSYFGGISAGKQPKDTSGAEEARQMKDTPKICQNCGGGFIGYPMQRFCSDACGGVDNTPRQIKFGMKPKDLCLIPFRVAIAAQADGWWVRSVIIWSKPNPMPESVTDRPTESHEYILMLTKSSRYYWDADAVREPNITGDGTYMGIAGGKRFGGEAQATTPVSGFGERALFNNPLGRNIRSVWDFPTQPYPEAHFAVFPEALPRKCIMAATPEAGCCSKCGAPWERITRDIRHYKNIGGNASVESSLETGRRYQDWYQVESQTLGWRPTCQCNADTKPSTVLDPFAGRGTVGVVAKELNRNAILIDISEEYCALAKKCIEAVPLPMKL